MRIKLREAIEIHLTRTGQRLTYAQIAKLSGLSRATVESIATRPDYNATLDAIERLCRALGCTPGELLEIEDRRETQRQ